jgi:hypothetical protein
MNKGTKASGFTRDKAIPSMKMAGSDVQVMKSTTLDSYPHLYWVHQDGEVVGVVTKYRDGGCWVSIYRGKESERLPIEFTGASGVAMGVGAILYQTAKERKVD